jgi:flavin reductase (DIM6/NTAB) family NADH-FMN oxidoreductase RutF
MAVNPDNLRLAMRRWATGVTVVTSSFQGYRHGMTVNSFTSISLDPALVLVSIERKTRTYKLIEQAEVFGVTILSAGQQEISDCFAGRHTETEDRFSNLETFTLETGVPFIKGGTAFFDCKVMTTLGAGDHTVFVGEVIATGYDDTVDPLLYFDRNYRRLQI